MIERKLLINSTAIYALGAIAQQFIVLFFVKINTNILNQVEYGQYSLLKTTQGIVAVIIALSLQSGFTRFYREYKSVTELKNTAFSFIFFWSILVVITCFLLKSYLGNLILPSVKDAPIFLMMIIGSVAINALNDLYKVDYKMQYKAKYVVAIDLGIVLLNLALLVVFGIILKLQIFGVLLSNLISVFIAFTILFILDLKNFRIVINQEQLKPMLTYSIGLIMSQLSSWVLTFIDRYYLLKYYDYAIVGIYSVGYKIGFMIRPLFTLPFTEVFTPYKFQIYKDKNARLKFQKAFKYYNVIGWIVIFAFAVFSRLGIILLTTSEYLNAYQIIPLVSFSYFVFTLTVFYGFGLHVVNRMFLNSAIITIGAVFNIGLNILLIPWLGMHGAAIATILSYVLVNIIYFFIGRKYWDTGISLLSPYKITPIFLVLYFVYWKIVEFQLFIVYEVIASIVLLVLFIVCLTIFGFLTKKEIRIVKEQAMKFTNRFKTK